MMASKVTLLECARYVFICISISFVLVPSATTPITAGNIGEAADFWTNNSCTFPPATTFQQDVLAEPDEDSRVLKPCFSKSDFSQTQGEADAFTGVLCNALYTVSKALCSKSVLQSYLTPDKVMPFVEDDTWDVCKQAKATGKRQLLFMTEDRTACERYCMNDRTLGPVCRLLVTGVINYMQSLVHWKDSKESNVGRNPGSPPQDAVTQSSDKVTQKPDAAREFVDPDAGSPDPAVADDEDLYKDKAASGTGAAWVNSSSLNKGPDRSGSWTGPKKVQELPDKTRELVDPNAGSPDPADNGKTAAADDADLYKEKGASGTGAAWVNHSSLNPGSDRSGGWTGSKKVQELPEKNREFVDPNAGSPDPADDGRTGAADDTGTYNDKGASGTGAALVNPSSLNKGPDRSGSQTGGKKGAPQGTPSSATAGVGKMGSPTDAGMDDLHRPFPIADISTKVTGRADIKVDVSQEGEDTSNKNIGPGRSQTGAGVGDAVGQTDNEEEDGRDALAPGDDQTDNPADSESNEKIDSTVHKPEDLAAEGKEDSSSLRPFEAPDDDDDDDDYTLDEEEGNTADGEDNHDSEILSGPKIAKQPDFPGDGVVKIPRQMEVYEEESSGHFMAYFVTAVVLCIAGYVIYHNKQKILAFVLEGRRDAQRRRTTSSGTAKYSKLQPSVEEVMPSLDNSATTKNFIY